MLRAAKQKGGAPDSLRIIAWRRLRRELPWRELMKLKKSLVLGAAAAIAAAAIMPFSAGAAKAENRFTLTDLVIVSQYLAGKKDLTEQQIREFDLTGDGRVTLSDLVQMARGLSGKPPVQPTPAPSTSGAPSTATAAPVPPSVAPTTATVAPTAPPLTPEQIKELALSRVPGATQANIVSVKPDMEMGIPVYDVELRIDGVEYDFEYTTSGTLIKEEVDWPVDPSYQGGAQTEQSARQIAISQVPGATDSNIVSCTLDTEDNVRVYEVDLVYTDQAWTFDIVQATGQIIHRSFEIRPMPVPMPTLPAGSTPAEEYPTSAPSVTTIPDTGVTIQQAQQLAVDRIPGASLGNVVSAKDEYENGVTMYEIEIQYDGAAYEYQISYSGIIVKESMERPVTPGYNGTQQTEQSATAIALAFAPGATEDDITYCRSDREDGVPIYEIQLVYRGERWTIEIVQATGEVIEKTMEMVFEPSPPPIPPSAVPEPTIVPETTPTPSSAAISREEAVSIALTCAAGATSSDVVKCELDTDHGQLVWEIEIRHGGVEYEIEISAAGQILQVDTDRD